MRHAKRFKQLNDLSPNRDIGYITGKAKRGCKAELMSAKELQGLLRDYTYHLIGLGNTFCDIARTYGVFHGSNWRSYRGVVGAQLKALAEQLNSMDPYDTDSILKIERAIEALAESLKVVPRD
jgi:Glu-tRNA(Gln) amidotransferase subunit E-like FAD-binding protein